MTVKGYRTLLVGVFVVAMLTVTLAQRAGWSSATWPGT